jgi:adenine deaminase
MVTRSIDNIIHPTVYIDGVKVAENGVSLIASVPGSIINQFESHYCPPELFRLSETYASKPAIAVLDGQIITGKFPVEYRLKDSFVLPDLDQDVIYLAVVNRYRKAPPALAMVHGTGIQQGALASSVAHDSHNIVVCGTTAEDMAAAVQLVMEHQGGLAISVGEVKHILPLPVAGLMSNQDGFETAHSYIQLDQIAKQYTQTTLSAPFMTLSFLALPVIPHLKLSDLGLFDVDQFAFC